MGSPISPIVANLYMEDFEIRAIQSSPKPPLLWRRFVDDTFVIMKKCHREEFMKHLNSVDTKALMKCNYPRWALNRVRMKMNSTAHKDKNRNKTGPTQHNNTPRPHITVPYYRGTE